MRRNMLRPRVSQAMVSLGVAMAALLFTGLAQAAPIVTPTVTDLGGSFRYDYTIDNTAGLEDIVLVNILVAPLDPTLTNLFAPMGFQTVHDDNLGIVTFLPDLGVFDTFAAGTSLSGFRFESALPPGASTFEALTISGELLTGMTIATSATSPTPPLIPEPGTAGLLLASLGLLLTRRGGRKSPAQPRRFV